MSRDNSEDVHHVTEPPSTSLYSQAISRLKQSHKLSYEREKCHLEKRKKSFDLLRHLEDSSRFHNNEYVKELKQGHILFEDVFSEFNRRSIDSNSVIYSFSIRKFFENYLADYSQRKVSDDPATFPWGAFDETMEKNCIGVLSTNRVNEARSYLIGYVEVICQVPAEFLSNQGKVTLEAAGWALSRHPYCSIMAAFQVALSLLIKEVLKETISMVALKGIIDCFVLISQQSWSLCWQKCSNSSADLPEILVEAVQHSLFLNCPYLPGLLYGSGLFDESNAFSNNEPALVELRQPLRLIDLYRLCGVPKKYHIFTAIPEISPEHRETTQSLTLSAEESCWLSISKNPFLVLSRDISVLRVAKTPAEVADVAKAILTNLNRQSKAIAMTTDGSVINSQGELSADEMIPLLTFVFALYFHTPVRQKGSNYFRYQNPNHFIALLKFAESYMPNHLSLREEGYAVTVCLSALQTLPV